jgi:hypothetical protein
MGLTPMSERIRIKVGSVELEWESDGSLSLDDVKKLLKDLGGFAPAFDRSGPSASKPDAKERTRDGEGGGASQKLFITSIAKKLGAKSGRDLARAAAAYLQITEGQTSFSRRDLLEAMKKAPSYYKETYRKNLSAIIDHLIPKVLNQIGEGTYSLTASELTAIETALA